jgi:hypothetical protein
LIARGLRAGLIASGGLPALTLLARLTALALRAGLLTGLWFALSRLLAGLLAPLTGLFTGLLTGLMALGHLAGLLARLGFAFLLSAALVLGGLWRTFATFTGLALLAVFLLAA